MNHKEAESEIQELTQLLKQVVLEKQKITEKEDHIRSEIERLVHTAETKSTNRKSSKENNKIPAIPHNRFDRNNKEIKIGDKVRFLTPTKYKSKEGTTAYFTKQRVTSIDHRHIKISKESKNLEVIETHRDTNHEF